MNRVPSLALVAFVAAACQPARETATNDSAEVLAVQQIAQDAAAAHRAGDSLRLGSLFAEDAIVMTNGGPSITGRTAITSMFAGIHRQFTVNATIEPAETRVARDWAFMRTDVSGSLVPKAGGAPIALDLKEIVIAQKQPDGSWKVARLIGNNNRPSTPPSAVSR